MEQLQLYHVLFKLRQYLMRIEKRRDFSKFFILYLEETFRDNAEKYNEKLQRIAKWFEQFDHNVADLEKLCILVLKDTPSLTLSKMSELSSHLSSIVEYCYTS